MAAYTTSAAILALAGQVAVDLRTDDDDQANLLNTAIDYATEQLDWYLAKYSQVQIAASHFAQHAATFIAVKWLCLHRLNSVPASIQKEWTEEWEPKLGLIQQGKAVLPRASTSRNPVSVTNYSVDLRRMNNQIRVDRSRSTGVAQDYKRPTDPNAPDQR